MVGKEAFIPKLESMTRLIKKPVSDDGKVSTFLIQTENTKLTLKAWENYCTHGH